MKLVFAAAGLLLALLGGCGGEDEAAHAPPNVAARIEVAEPIGVTVGAGSLWVASFADSAVVRIDPATRQVVARIPVGKGPIGVGFARLCLERRLVGWDGDSNRSCDEPGGRDHRRRRRPEECVGTRVTLDVQQVRVGLRIHPATNREIARIDVAPELRYLAATSDAIWVASFDESTLHRIDPETNMVVRTVPAGSGPQGVAAGEGSLWVASYDTAEVLELDPVSGAVRRTSRCPSEAGRRGSHSRAHAVGREQPRRLGLQHRHGRRESDCDREVRRRAARDRFTRRRGLGREHRQRQGRRRRALDVRVLVAPDAEGGVGAGAEHEEECERVGPGRRRAR